MSRPVLFLLHSLGSSKQEWRGIQDALNERFECIALDIPGFGGTSADAKLSVDTLVDWFEQEVSARAPVCWFVAGHSMGGKIATLTAARSRDGAEGLAGLVGVALVAGSPPCPEPMSEERRQHMLGWFRENGPSRQDAEEFIDANSAKPLSGAIREAAIADMLRADPAAWCAWLEQGSRQHCQAEVGLLHVPALILAGAEDGDLGESAQRSLNAPHYANARVDVIPDAAHLIPLEQPEQLASRIENWALPLLGRALPAAFVELVNTRRVTPRMRARLLARHATPPPVSPTALPPEHMALLIALASRLVPVADAEDLGLRVGHALVAGEGDGWRFADLPGDAKAWAMGLQQLDAECGGFGKLDEAAQDDLLRKIARGHLAGGATMALDAGQWAHWFEDVRALFARTWMSLPSTWALLGYDGFAVGGRGADSLGYQRTEADDLNPWQLPC